MRECASMQENVREGEREKKEERKEEKVRHAIAAQGKGEKSIKS